MTLILLIAATCCILSGSAALVYQGMLMPAASRPTLGVPGLKRSAALAHPGFRLVEPGLRALAGLIADVPLGRVRSALRSQIRVAGDIAGLSPAELLAMSGLSGFIGCGLGLVAVQSIAVPFLSGLTAAIGCALPLIWLRAVARRRTSQIEAALPSAVELSALCMSAGLDFPGALRQLTTSRVGEADPLLEELGQVLQELELGSTRKHALLRFADRVPSDAIRQFCNSVVQAEEKGAPVARALQIQAQTLRLRRSIAAEERASGAALRLVGPMALVFLSVILLVIAPLVVRFGAGEFQLL